MCVCFHPAAQRAQLNPGADAFHDDPDTGEAVVQGPPLTDPANLAQLRHFVAAEVAAAEQKGVR
ncbi:hypothetical protein [Streptomyces sp. NPDC003077]|uniref:hypothetical protein n=1 Tax=Streptomyces sp. NPDC003077 TaxID=3154443 RepID=UPI00339F1EAD